MTTYSLIFNPGTPNEYREENDLSLVLPVENKQQ